MSKKCLGPETLQVEEEGWAQAALTQRHSLTLLLLGTVGWDKGRSPQMPPLPWC